MIGSAESELKGRVRWLLRVFIFIGSEIFRQLSKCSGNNFLAFGVCWSVILICEIRSHAHDTMIPSECIDWARALDNGV